jgi:hypothetical protein
VKPRFRAALIKSRTFDASTFSRFAISETDRLERWFKNSKYSANVLKPKRIRPATLIVACARSVPGLSPWNGRFILLWLLTILLHSEGSLILQSDVYIAVVVVFFAVHPA